MRRLPGMKIHDRVKNSAQYWVRKRETDLQIGFKHDTWYSVNQELGTKGIKKLSLLRETVVKSIPDIRSIQAKYLSGVSDDSLALIDESEATPNNE
jgi:hypothetical protein